MKAKAPEWALLEIENEFFDNLSRKLRNDGAVLTRAERKALLDLVRNRPKQKRGRGRPPREPSKEFKAIGMALYCIKRETRGEPPKVAVAETAHRFGVSIKTVYAARQQLSSK
jgi:hypothetical protein